MQPPQVFTVRGFETLFPCIGNLGCLVSLAPQSFLLVYLHVNVGPPGLPAAALPGPPGTVSPGQLVTTHSGLPPAALLRVLSTPAAHLPPSYWPG